MGEKWNLSSLYPSFESKEFLDDIELFKQLVKEAVSYEERFLHDTDYVSLFEDYMLLEEKFSILMSKLYGFVNLTLATDTVNKVASKYQLMLSKELVKLSKVNALQAKVIKNVDVDELISNSAFLSEYEFILREGKLNSNYALSEELEELASKLRQSSSSLWNKQFGILTSTHMIEFDGEELPLPALLNLTEHKDEDIRKRAYEAEIASYKKIEKAVAFSLNGIKTEVNTMTKLRGYDSPLSHALSKSRMKKETLDAMITAMKEYLPHFRAYLRRKGELLGYNDGLPFYNLYAPIGNSEKTFTIKEANEYILKNFATFSTHLYELAKKAFDQDWIDYRPYKGKRGGAFCSNLSCIKESRILLNMTGTFSDVITMAHELGHAYHGDNIFSEKELNTSYTMPVAETASTFCETIVMKAALEDASLEEKLFLVESDLQGNTQIIVDILSRFIFESNVFKTSENEFLDEEKLKEMMLEAQEQTYGNGLDQRYRHPYMWIWKPHYYSASLSFYNFPYAFGLLFAKGLYAKYLENKDTFPQKYDLLLKATGKLSVEDVVSLVDIDVTDINFWRSSLEVLKEDIDLFLELAK